MPHQLDVFRSPARFKIVAAGRRWGKTKLGIAQSFATAWLGGRVWWIAPNYPIGAIAWREIARRSHSIAATVRQGDKIVTFPPGEGYIQLKSADNVNSLRGEGLDLAILDEAAFTLEAAWHEAIRPALADRQGEAAFYSTPNGRNWFHRLFANASGLDEWEAWQFPTSDNAHIPAGEIALAESEMPSRTFLQEFEAHFIDAAGAVFRGVRSGTWAIPQEIAQPKHLYVFGIDWARESDFTAIIVLDMTTAEIVHVDAWTGLGYDVQLARVSALVERFRPVAVVSEANNMGAVLTETLQAAGVPVMPFVTTNATKLALVDSLVLALERNAIALAQYEPLLQELEAYQATRLPSGLTRYGAPAGVHDDLVMALMLAVWGAGNASVDMTARLM